MNIFLPVERAVRQSAGPTDHSAVAALELFDGYRREAESVDVASTGSRDERYSSTTSARSSGWSSSVGGSALPQ